MRKFILASLAIMSTSAFAANEMYVLGGVGINEDDTGAQFTVGSQILDTNFYLESTMNYIDSDSSDVISDVNGDLTKYKGDYQHFKMSLAPMYKYSFDDSLLSTVRLVLLTQTLILNQHGLMQTNQTLTSIQIASGAQLTASVLNLSQRNQCLVTRSLWHVSVSIGTTSAQAA